MLAAFGKPDPGIDDDRLSRDTRCDRAVNGFRQLTNYLTNDVVSVFGKSVCAHLGHTAAGVHENHTRVARCGNLADSRVDPKARHVVDHVGACIERGARHRCLRRVDR